MEKWANFRLPMYEFYKKKIFKRTKLWWEILKDIQQAENGKITYAIVKDEYLEKTNTSAWDTTWITNEFLANMDWSEACFLLYNIWGWKIKWSLRSKSIDVSSVCAELWWGWHKLAAWFSTELSMEEITEVLITKIKKLL
jgi:phosphoesterase RecJ-like protein